ncbi:helix-turn-helix domain-containing protein [Tropicimonas aquimaris]|uniref:Helix-turn-helix domain-containing protein n=1 Tax=Tropicimonas aquimaris TaxID=914152 RepID=A0ABW3ISY4_9RHOB
MTDRYSLFARRLREFRVSGGVHGRMTQEQLADLIGVSVDAIGKYERSLSFIRGDLEHRLIEVLGWSAAEVTECRLDWDAFHLHTRKSRYRQLDDAMLDEVFDGDMTRVSHAIHRLFAQVIPDISDDFGPEADRWDPIITRFRHHGCCVYDGTELVGHWGLQFLNQEDTDRFYARRLLESDLDADRLRRPIMPGLYFGYCPVVAILPGHEAIAPMMLSSFLRFLEELAEREVFVSAIGAITVSAEGEQFCGDLGMDHLGGHRLQPGFGVWALPGASVPASLIGRRSPGLGARYRAAFGRPG